MLSDIEISSSAKPFKINKIAKKLNLTSEDIIPYGHYKAKLSHQTLNTLLFSENKEEIYSNNSALSHPLQYPLRHPHKLILITAITPTPAGEGKSTVSIGLADALSSLGVKTALSLREPSLGPCFGSKGGACGGGYSQIIPMDEINLNFTGDLHAITAANNLLAAMIDNHIKNGNATNIAKICFERCLDMNDRALREIRTGLGGKKNGSPRTTGFNITAASEIMAILCLAENLSDLKQKLGNIIIAENKAGLPVYAKDIKAAGAMTALLKDAFCPNLVQTLEHTPAFVHGGPFANIAHGTSSVIAARSALALADCVITEAGFGADLGAEKFFDIFARKSNIYPSAVVLVATIRALKMHGGTPKEHLNRSAPTALVRGFSNLTAHINNIKKFGLTPIIAINRFATDSKEELKLVEKLCRQENTQAIIANGWEKGSKGCINLAKTVLNELNMNQNLQKISLLYPDNLPLKDKISQIARKIYNARAIKISTATKNKLNKFTRWGYGHLPICIAKTQNSISHDKNLLGAPEDYIFPITDVRLSAGAGFVVALSGEINTMPGLPPHPAAENIDIDENGIISGLF